MNLVSLKVIALLCVMLLFIGCASTSTDNNNNTPDCNKTLIFVESPKNTVSGDGFTIFFDAKDKTP